MIERPPKGRLQMIFFEGGQPIGHIEKADHCYICYLIDEEEGSVKFYEFNPSLAVQVDKRNIDYSNVVYIERNGVPIAGLDKTGFIYIFDKKTWKISLENPKRWKVEPEKMRKHLNECTSGG